MRLVEAPAAGDFVTCDSHHSHPSTAATHQTPLAPPCKLHESPARMLTSPIHTLASVPFKWEDAPGKPRPPCMPQSDEPKIDRCSELPPRLLAKAQESDMPSPATVLDGPYVPRSWSLGKGSSSVAQRIWARR
ncbi:hypothetical protein NC652_028990 [Populus alba x Populus x berolinensis]|nr:hypothetical protein NC652_028990 [Populus alba x Populus x berolinensis]